MQTQEHWWRVSTASMRRIGRPREERWRVRTTSLESWLLGLAEPLALLTAFSTVWLVVGREVGDLGSWLILAAAWMLGGALFYRCHDHADRSLSRRTVDDFPAIVHWIVGGVALTAVIDASLRPWVAGVLGVAVLSCAVLMRGMARRLARRWSPPERILLVGDGELYEVLSRKVTLERALHVQVMDHLSISTLAGASGAAEGFDAWLGRLVAQKRCDRVVVGSESMLTGQLRTVIAACRAARVNVSVLPTLCAAVGSRARLNHLAELPMLEFRCGPMSAGSSLVKRAFDIAIASALLLATVPLMIAVAAAIRLESGGSVLFRQQRGGCGGRPFWMFKFRTMVSDAEQRLAEVIDVAALDDPMYKLERDPRLTGVGGFLRKTSLDELPQLLNVLRGDMSMVGPRPEVFGLVKRYDAEALAIRCGMRPGITGPMQVHGRGQLTFKERLAVEREYLENHSLTKDLRILMLTVSVLVSRQGAY